MRKTVTTGVSPGLGIGTISSARNAGVGNLRSGATTNDY